MVRTLDRAFSCRNLDGYAPTYLVIGSRRRQLPASRYHASF